jgi:hypothetical protein
MWWLRRSIGRMAASACRRACAAAIPAKLPTAITTRLRSPSGRRDDGSCLVRPGLGQRRAHGSPRSGCLPFVATARWPQPRAFGDRWGDWGLGKRLRNGCSCRDDKRGRLSDRHKHRKGGAIRYFAGLDVSLEATSICVVDETGRILKEVRAASEPDPLVAALQQTGLPLERIGLEACTLMAWLHDGLRQAGLPAICIEARRANAAMTAMPPGPALHAVQLILPPHHLRLASLLAVFPDCLTRAPAALWRLRRPARARSRTCVAAP